eukprot:1154470-Pelagomonas_calceolata.AAC.9
MPRHPDGGAYIMNHNDIRLLIIMMIGRWSKKCLPAWKNRIAKLHCPSEFYILAILGIHLGSGQSSTRARMRALASTPSRLFAGSHRWNRASHCVSGQRT